MSKDDTHKETNEDQFEDVAFEEDEESTAPEKSSKVEKLKKKLAACEEEKNTYLDQWQRSQAEFVNIRRRDEEEKKQAATRGKEEVILEVLPVLDSFEQAFADREGWESAPETWRTGVEHIYAQLAAVLKTEKVEPIPAIGEPFDPARHEALVNEPVTSPDKDNTVVEEIQRGYIREGRVLRPAKVKVGVYQAEE